MTDKFNRLSYLQGRMHPKSGRGVRANFVCQTSSQTYLSCILFQGDEDDLEVRSAVGDTVYIDVTHAMPEFKGEVQIGVHGKLRNVILEAIAQ